MGISLFGPYKINNVNVINVLNEYDIDTRSKLFQYATYASLYVYLYESSLMRVISNWKFYDGKITNWPSLYKIPSTTT